MLKSNYKYRHEYKYLISSAQISLLINRIKCIMKLDDHVGSKGFYNIRSVYFDDYYNSCFYDNEIGVDPREKIRIRIYNQSSSRISLECKQKSNDKTLKHSMLLTHQEANAFISGKGISISPDQHELYNKLGLNINMRGMKPSVIVDYDRIPYIYKQGNVRVTFDFNISSASVKEDFFSSNICKRPIMPVGYCLMEVKFDEFIPDFIYHSLNLGQLRRETFSKYYLARKFLIN